MRKITQRTLQTVESGEPITVKFTTVQGATRGGRTVTHEGELTDDNSEDALTYQYEGDEYTYELDTGYVRTDGDVLGRDARAKVK